MPSYANARKDVGKINLFRVGGIRISIDFSWFVIFVLILWSLSVGYFPREFPAQNAYSYWGAGIVATLLFFLSVIFHELAHSLIAIRSGLQIPEITLFIFGGISKLSEDAKDAADEFKIAVVGPLSSFVLAVVFMFLEKAARSMQLPMTAVIFGYLTWINFALAVFNLIPGFPLDGGRILRAFLWWKTGSLTSATKYASDVGKGLAVAMMILGGIQIFGGMLIGGLWLIFIGAFLRGVAEGSYQEVLMRQSLEGVKVDEVMVREVVGVPPDLPVSRLISAYLLRYGYKGYPVMERAGEPIGIVEIFHIKDIHEEDRQSRTVAEVMEPINPDLVVEPDLPLIDALKKIGDSDLGRLLVIQNKQMVGLITKSGLNRFLEIRSILRS